MCIRDRQGRGGPDRGRGGISSGPAMAELLQRAAEERTEANPNPNPKPNPKPNPNPKPKPKPKPNQERAEALQAEVGHLQAEIEALELRLMSSDGERVTAAREAPAQLQKEPHIHMWHIWHIWHIWCMRA
eukprot:scaffold59007_cov39-Phaeocystis_antarctica.AAC.1